MILMSGVNRLYRSDEIETTALRDVELHVETGEFVAVMGPSGSGKSTLLNIIGLLDRPTSGNYRFLDREVTSLEEPDLAKLRKLSLGFVFQNFNLIDELTVAENVELPLTYHGLPRKARRERVAAALERVGLNDRARHFPHQLSGGQQQRAAIARAVVARPALILADEPTGNLDTKNGEQVMGILQRLNAEGATIVMVTHDQNQAARAQRTVHMLDGRIVPPVRDAA